MTDTPPIPTEADIALIQRVIPHRYPFLLIDRVIGIDPFRAATGIKNVTFNEPQFQGHFPGMPIMPGVTIVEAMAQTSAVLVSLSARMEDMGALVYFMGIDKCRFRRKVVPGDVLHLNVETIRGRAGSKVWKFAGQAKVDGEIAAEAEFSAMIDLGGGGAA